MRFIMRCDDEASNAMRSPRTNPTTNRPRSYRSTQQTRRRNDLPDTTTITISHATNEQLLTNKILDADPNRESHYNAPTLKNRILF